MTSLQQTAMGGGSATTKTASYVLVAADAGTTVTMTSASATTITVNTSLFAAGDTVYIQNLSTGVCTITAGTATVNTSATLALAQYEGGQLYFNSTSAAIFIKGAGASGGGGKVLQVVQATTSTTTSSTSTTFVNSNIAATITPSLNTSKVLVLIAATECYKGSDANNGLQLRLTRGATSIFVFATQNGRNGTASGNSFNVASHYLDSPATTSATTYTVQLASNNTTQVGVADNGVSTIILMEIGA
jgi:hypothetical protein